MSLFKKQIKLSEKELEARVKENFCKLKTIVACNYAGEIWCPKECGYYKRAIEQIKY